MKILVIRNKNKVIRLTNRESLQDIGKRLDVEIIEMNNVEVWKRLREGTLDSEIKKIWMVVKDYQLAKYLELKGYKVFNKSSSIEICDNKGIQSIYLKDYVPKTQLCPLIYNAKDISVEDFSEIKYPCILKEFYSSFGKGVYKINNEEELEAKIKELNTYLFLIQDFIDTSDNEYQAISYRVCVVGKKVVAIMMNCSRTDYRTQTIHGGEHFICSLPSKVINMIYEVMDIVGNDFAGIDVFKDKNTDKWYISEVNSSGGLEILSKLYGRELIEDIILYIKER